MALQGMLQTFSRFSRNCFLTSSLHPNTPLKASVAFICRKELMDPNVEKPAPWPYEEKKFGYFQQFYDITTKRFDENTKIIVVDGNIAAGKTALAKQLADEFGMKYIPEPNLEEVYTSQYGYDLRELDSVMPPAFKSYLLKDYYANPHHPNVTRFQKWMFIYRYSDYLDALAHLLNSGQGIVFDRSVYSDFVFMHTMFESGFVRKEVVDLYDLIYENCVTELLRPNLVIYLDVPVDILQERIKARNNPIEVGSKVLTNAYLQGIAEHYTHDFLPQMGKHSELLIYDWSNYGDVDVVISDIEKIDFDAYDQYDIKMKDWRREDHWEWSQLRMYYGNEKYTLLAYTEIFHPEVPEAYFPPEDAVKHSEIMSKVPGEKYMRGFNPIMGDKVIFKVPGYRPV